MQHTQTHAAHAACVCVCVSTDVYVRTLVKCGIALAAASPGRCLAHVCLWGAVCQASLGLGCVCCLDKGQRLWRGPHSTAGQGMGWVFIHNCKVHTVPDSGSMCTTLASLF